MVKRNQMIECFLCGDMFQFGPGIYRGRKVAAWNIMVCNGCRTANHEGIVPSAHPRLVQHLNELGIRPKINSEGWICWPE
jgi:hypothetical protein